jgi:CPA2 family monovalent cation:H+ antiporter-2
LCFTGAALSGALGLSASYGAFVAGLLIGSTPHSHRHEERVRPLFDILMMVFFLSVGLLIDLRFVWDHLGTLVLFLFAVLTLKTFVNTAVLRHMGMHRRHALRMGTVLGQLGEFSFIIVALGLETGAIEHDAYQFAVTLIALSLIFTPVWLNMTRRTVLVRRWHRRRTMKKAIA